MPSASGAAFPEPVRNIQPVHGGQEEKDNPPVMQYPPQYKRGAALALVVLAASAAFTGFLAGSLISAEIFDASLIGDFVGGPNALLKGDLAFAVLGGSAGFTLLMAGVAKQRNVDTKTILETLITPALFGLGLGIPGGADINKPVFAFGYTIIFRALYVAAKAGIYISANPYRIDLSGAPSDARKKARELKQEAFFQLFFYNLAGNRFGSVDKALFLRSRAWSVLAANSFDADHLVGTQTNLPNPEANLDIDAVTEKIQNIVKENIDIYDFSTVNEGTCFGDSIEMIKLLQEGKTVEQVCETHIEGSSPFAQAIQLTMWGTWTKITNQTLVDRISFNDEEMGLDTILERLKDITPKEIYEQIVKETEGDPISRIRLLRNYIHWAKINPPSKFKFLFVEVPGNLGDSLTMAFQMNGLRVESSQDINGNVEEELNKLPEGIYFLGAQDALGKNTRGHAMVFYNDGTHKYFFNPGIGTFKYAPQETMTAVQKTQAWLHSDTKYKVYRIEKATESSSG